MGTRDCICLSFVPDFSDPDWLPPSLGLGARLDPSPGAPSPLSFGAVSLWPSSSSVVFTLQFGGGRHILQKFPKKQHAGQNFLRTCMSDKAFILPLAQFIKRFILCLYCLCHVSKFHTSKGASSRLSTQPHWSVCLSLPPNCTVVSATALEYAPCLGEQVSPVIVHL